VVPTTVELADSNIDFASECAGFFQLLCLPGVKGTAALSGCSCRGLDKMWDEELKLAIMRELAWYPSSAISYHEDPPASTRHENARTPPTYQPKFVSIPCPREQNWQYKALPPGHLSIFSHPQCFFRGSPPSLLLTRRPKDFHLYTHKPPFSSQVGTLTFSAQHSLSAKYWLGSKPCSSHQHRYVIYHL
jgi:hypothetical protein